MRRVRRCAHYARDSDGGMMDYFLSEEQKAIVEIARTVALTKIKPVR